ncbi:hypothetical protein CYMTET_25847 [Cymbomonas tetramitiformis]|uniref:C3H1-type domain-containing protein n=1 Tax=Cymbomonas tetramitiformis TaxID=36881 RepID=A0AAE0KYG4_9CHLO|nr:hypothetical protein CYMTET_25847 [Cymbomonas tetramitiformis]
MPDVGLQTLLWEVRAVMRQIEPEKMPVCSYFLQGACSVAQCPYLHVNVDPAAPLCQAFLRGYCPKGGHCSNKHSLLCQPYAATGTCPNRARCRMHHPALGTAARRSMQRPNGTRLEERADADGATASCADVQMAAEVTNIFPSFTLKGEAAEGCRPQRTLGHNLVLRVTTYADTWQCKAVIRQAASTEPTAVQGALGNDKDGDASRVRRLARAGCLACVEDVMDAAMPPDCFMQTCLVRAYCAIVPATAAS